MSRIEKQILDSVTISLQMIFMNKAIKNIEKL